LPDCRAYEQVSPVESGGYNAVDWAGLETAQAAAGGERVFYQGNTVFAGAGGNTAATAGHLSIRTEAGWRTIELTPSTATLAAEKEGWMMYQGVNEELTEIIFKAPLALTPSANLLAFNLYARNLSSEPSWTSPEYTWINDLPLLAPASEMCDVPAQVGVSPEKASCYFAVGYAGASSDLRHILFESQMQLMAGAPAYGVEALYENSGGVIRIVGVLPNGEIAPTGATAGAGSSTYAPRAAKPLEPGRADRRVERAMAASGERSVFEAESNEGEADEEGQRGLAEVYDRIGNSTEHASTIELSARAAGAAPKVSKAEPATFWAASTDGSRVFFTSSAELTSQSNTGAANEGSDLYEARLEEQGASQPPKVALSDLSVDNTDSAGADVLGVVGASEDGEYIYFVADGQLVSGKGVAGKPNLYMERNAGRPIFIATLRPGVVGGTVHEEELALGDSLDWTQFGEVQRAYVTPDGRHLGFMSVEEVPTVNFPSGYDNVASVTQEHESEVFEYSAPSPTEEAKGMTGQLTCASCDPTGAPPTGNAFLAGTGDSLGNGPSEEEGQETPTAAGSSFFHPRSVSNSGMRVFFAATPFTSETVANSQETPVAKIYEYEQDGEGSCATRVGCTYRVSGATNPTRDLFVGASAEGEDVFFATYSQLTATDKSALFDVYDARIDGGFPAATPAPECVAGCRSASTSAEGAPLVSALVGPSGNLAPPASSAGKSIKSPTKSREQSPCVMKAKKIKNAKARKRALGRCSKSKASASHARARRDHRPRGGHSAGAGR
jgi:hypothetical protein